MKKFFNVLGVLFGIPILLYVLLEIGNLIVLKSYIYIHHINKSTLTISSVHKILEPRIYLGSIIGEGLLVVMLIIIYLPAKEGLIKRCKFRKFDKRKIPVIISLVLSLNFLSIVFIKYAQNHVTSYKNVEHNMSFMYSNIFILLGTIFIIPIFEEIIFRGAIFGTLKRNLNVIVALILQAIIFAVMHGNLLQGVYTFILGIIVGLAYLYTKSIWGDILCHMTYNLFGLLILPIMAYMYFNYIVYGAIGVILLIISFVLFRKNKMSLNIH